MGDSWILLLFDMVSSWCEWSCSCREMCTCECYYWQVPSEWRTTVSILTKVSIVEKLTGYTLYRILIKGSSTVTCILYPLQETDQRELKSIVWGSRGVEKGVAWRGVEWGGKYEHQVLLVRKYSVVEGIQLVCSMLDHMGQLVLTVLVYWIFSNQCTQY